MTDVVRRRRKEMGNVAVFLVFFPAATNFALPAYAQDSSFGRDEAYLSASPWKYVGGDTTYGLTDISGDPPDCMRGFNFRPSHDLVETCSDGTSRKGQWRLDIRSGQEVILLTVADAAESSRIFNIYYGDRKKPLINLVETNSDKLAKKHVFVYKRR